MLGLWAGAAQMPANGIAHGPAMPPRGVDTAGRERRDDARGVAGQAHARAGDRAFRPAARHQPGAGGRRPRGGRNADHIAHVPKEAIDIRRPHLCRVMAQCQAHLQARRILNAMHRPAAIAGQRTRVRRRKGCHAPDRGRCAGPRANARHRHRPGQALRAGAGRQAPRHLPPSEAGRQPGRPARRGLGACRR
ncbi:hypothetical protein G6F59_015477 [Rhizopus arrhizus]|nr:hypothetical protein G6F59_015477 [Rhizopus arrhizus]